MIKTINNAYCQKVLPLVYDDSLSYYENLCKLTFKMNEIIAEINNNFNDLIKQMIDEKFNNLMIGAIYDETSETIILKREETSTTSEVHTYNFSTGTMKIGD